MLDQDELITMTRGELDAMNGRYFERGLDTGMLIGNRNGTDNTEHAAHVDNMRRYDLILDLDCGCQKDDKETLIYCEAHKPTMKNEAAVIRNLSRLAMKY